MLAALQWWQQHMQIKSEGQEKNLYQVKSSSFFLSFLWGTSFPSRICVFLQNYFPWQALVENEDLKPKDNEEKQL
jgi:hypothetical protein